MNRTRTWSSTEALLDRSWNHELRTVLTRHIVGRDHCGRQAYARQFTGTASVGTLIFVCVPLTIIEENRN